MDNTLATVGTILTTEPQRDAVHFALAPVVATRTLRPGQHISLAGDHQATEATPSVGIVDPFLLASVQPGERFWLFLYPHTITSLRHLWTHPAFSGEADDPVARSRRWLEGLAARCDQTYNRLMAAAAIWVDEGEYTYDNSETYKGVDFTGFWEHYEVVTGAVVAAERKKYGASFFTCSC